MTKVAATLTDDEHQPTSQGAAVRTGNATKKAVDYDPVQCLVEITADDQITVVVRPECSMDDVEDMLRLLMFANGSFRHLMVRDEY